MRAAMLLGALALVFAGCLAPDDGERSAPTPTDPTPATPTPSAACARLTVDAVPETGPAGMPRALLANFTNCGDETIRLAHACIRGIDIRIHVLYNSTDPANATPPGVGPMASYLVDNPIANKPLACATAPPHVREVAAGRTLTYAIAWSGLVDDARCYPGDCPRALQPGRYLLAANAEDADTREAYVATRWLTLERARFQPRKPTPKLRLADGMRAAVSMNGKLTHEEIRKVAKARVAFKVHAAVYVIVNLFLVGVWFVTNWTGNADGDAWTFWPIWPEMAWGIGLAIHGYVTYGAGADWERREEEKLRKRHGGA